MIKKKLKTLACSVLTLGVFASVALLSTNAHAATTSKMGEDFSYFNTSNWSKSDGWSNGDMFNCTWRASNVNFYGNGQMELSITKDNKGGSVPYAGGEYRSNNKYGYGFYQVNMKPAKHTGVVSSFFTYTGPSDNTPWDEIDIEFLGKDTTKVQFNYYTNGVGNHEYLYNLGYDASNSFHTYAFNWQPNYIAWYVDGREVHKATTNIPKHPGKIMMNLWPGIGVDSWLNHFDGVTPVKAYYNWASYN
ncbi:MULTISPECIES: glycoside hydrolase family 16 protein [Clostridium]|uniref:Beta-glucanase n=1 Tax=Clostridium cibarium TaxID=2762247 RepID=A0ABR8PSU2_9CLOT|nr:MULTISPECIES: glycoside hydrolase family 16 protein [Clostridium]MBD7911212.1 glycoside hydrolase family 16 protein [Clostridium cibarium]